MGSEFGPPVRTGRSDAARPRSGAEVRARVPSARRVVAATTLTSGDRIVQTRLTVGAAGDRAERDADAMADQVMRHLDQWSDGRLDATGDRPIRRAVSADAVGADGGDLDDDTHDEIRRVAGRGHPLTADTRTAMEGAFGADFGAIRLHTDSSADRLSRRLSATAFTTGADVFFRAGTYQPATRVGASLLAHELAHTVQQGAAPPTPTRIQRSTAAGTRPRLDAERPAPRGASDDAVDTQRLGTRAVRWRIRRSAARMAPSSGVLVQRKLANLTETDVEQATGQKVAATIKSLVTDYNSHAEWDVLAGEVLKNQLEADAQTLSQIGELLVTALSDLETAEYKAKLAAMQPLYPEVGRHFEELQKRRAQVAAAEEAARPLKERYLEGLDLAGKQQYAVLLGDTRDMAEVSDDTVAKILLLYKRTTKKGKEVWQKDSARRERQKRDLGGPNGWVTEILGPHAKDTHVAAALQVLGAAKKPADLTQEQMIQIVADLHATGVADATEVTQFFSREVDKSAAGESAESVETKVTAIRERATAIRAQARGTLGPGTTWKELEPAIEVWRSEMLERAKKDTFETAYAAGRMTVRGIAKDSEQQGGTFPAQIMSGESGTTTGTAKMSLGRNKLTILDRAKPENWTGETTDRAAKQKTGLYELSASLLDPSRKNIFAQLKFYSSPEAVVFAPAADPSDYQIFAAISELADANLPMLRQISSEMTRIIMAQSTDMGTKYVDMSAGNAGTDIRYGESGTLIRYPGGIGKAARKHELEARKLNALQYPEILKDPKKVVNEVVVEYRKHASGMFPLFTEIDHNSKCFYILDPKTFAKKQGAYIDNQGNVFPK